MTRNLSVDLAKKDATAHSSLANILRQRAEQQPRMPVYTLLIDGEQEGATLNYFQVDMQARAIGATLQRLGAHGQRVLLVYPPGLEFVAAFYGCLYAGAVAVPTQLPASRSNNNQPLARFQAILNDASPVAILTTATMLQRLKSLTEHIPGSSAIHLIATDQIPARAAETWQQFEADADELALLQYTSGSTASPKGVMVSHRNLLENSAHIDFGFEHTEQSRSLSWLPHSHDMGLINGIIQPLYKGFQCYLMSPTAFVQSPYRWLKAISRYRVTHSGGPNFAYELCLRKVSAHQRADLDLSCWAVAFNGAEPVRKQTLEGFAEAFAPCGFRLSAFYPAYGLAEATLKVTGGSKQSEPVFITLDAAQLEKNFVSESSTDQTKTRSFVGAGKPACGTKIIIAHPQSKVRCAPDEIGEIWVSGPSVAQGYWNRKQESEEVFRAFVKDSGEGPFLRTGDLGFEKAGELFITGRIKDLIIIRGVNHYPQDIELSVERSHLALRHGGAAAFSIDSDGREQLVVAQELDFRQQPHIDEVMNSIRRAVAEQHEAQLHAIALVKPGALPKTTSGKIQRRLCRRLFLEDRLEAVSIWQAPSIDNRETAIEQAGPLRTEEEIAEWLRSIVASKIGIAPSSIDPACPITRYGLDSLTAIELMHRIQSACGVALSLSDFLESPSVAQLARLVKDSKDSIEPGSALPGMRAVEQDGDFPLSAGQQSLWFMQKIAPRSAAYNIAVGVRILTKLDVEALRRAFQTLTDRHSMLRVTFTDSRGEPFQRSRANIEVHFEIETAFQLSEADLKQRLAEEANAVLDLENGPLFKVKLFARSPREQVLLLVGHHIAVDLWSLAMLLEELGPLYSFETKGLDPGLDSANFQYADCVRWESERLAGPEGDRLRAYWQEQLSGACATLDLPSDRPRPKLQSFNGASLLFKISSELTGKIKQIGLRQNATLYMTLLAAFQALIHRHTARTDFLIGSPVSGRSRMETAKIVGYFVNPLVMRASVSGSDSFNGILSRARQIVIEALDHEGYPFPLLVKHLQPERDTSRSPIFQVLFALQKSRMLIEEGLAPFLLSAEGSRMRLGELLLESIRLEKKVAQFDLSLSMTEVKGEMLGSFEYNTDLFDEETIHRFAERFIVLIESLIATPDCPISQLQMMPEVERELLANWANTPVEYAQSEILSELFEQQTNRAPQKIALAFEGQEITYDELNRRANKLAHWLKRQGVGPDVLVALLMERSIEMVIGLFGILKAGGAYVPLDPHYPPQRLSFMSQDAQPKVLLTQQRFATRADFLKTKAICLDSEWSLLDDESDINPEASAHAESLAYVIYTSGSTGNPKGAMNTHRAITNRLRWMQAAYELNESDSVLQKTPFTFDVSVWEFFWPLIAGARLALARPGGHQDSAYLIALIGEQQITTIHFVPSMLHAFLDNPKSSNCRSLRRVICSGEALSVELQRRFFGKLDSELHNLYGPTEAAVDVTHWACERESNRAKVPIGHSIANIQIHILDEHLQQVPIGVAGELFIAGKGLARGYLNRPDLTGEKFIANPFSLTPGALMYRTGDLARFLARGEIEFLGRIDHQVKVRGFRIELGEIETALAEHVAISKAVVAAKEFGPADMRLTAYIVPTKDHISEMRALSASNRESSALSSQPARSPQTNRHRLPNGLLIAHDGEIQFNTMDIYREVFEKEIYLKHGISLRDGDCVFDVGAHIGLFALFVNQKCHPACVYAFEPLPPTFEVLQANVSSLGQRVKTFNFGLADRTKTDSFHYYPRMTGVSGRVADPAKHKKRRKPVLLNWFQSVMGDKPTTMLSEQDINEILEEYFKSETHECQLRTLSDVIRENNIERIDLLKIDVEESELDALAGIDEADWRKIKQVVVEVESKENLDLVVSMLEKRDFDVFADASDHDFSSDNSAEPNAGAKNSGAYMIYGLRRKALSVASINKSAESSFEILAPERGSVLGSDNLRSYLLARLPDYMVPSAFVLMDALPLLSNGKVNLNALPAPGFSRLQLEQEYLPPRTDAERALVKIFADVLGVEKVGIEDNFFKLGGHSLLATQAISRILERLKIEIPLERLFEQPTVAGLAEAVTSAKGFRVESLDPITRINHSNEDMLLARIDELSDEEVDALLKDVAGDDSTEEETND